MCAHISAKAALLGKIRPTYKYTEFVLIAVVISSVSSIGSYREYAIAIDGEAGDSLT